MRWCSREVGVGGSTCACWGCCAGRDASGSPAGGAPTDRSEELHPASASPSPSMASGASLAGFEPAPPCLRFLPRTATIPRPTLSVPLGDLDLLGPRGLDSRTRPLLQPASHPNAAILKPSQIEPGAGKGALVLFQDHDRECLGPASPK